MTPSKVASLILFIAGYSLLFYAFGPRITAGIIGIHLIWAGTN